MDHHWCKVGIVGCPHFLCEPKERGGVLGDTVVGPAGEEKMCHSVGRGQGLVHLGRGVEERRGRREEERGGEGRRRKRKGRGRSGVVWVPYLVNKT